MSSAKHPLRFLSLWSINAPLDKDRLCRQVDAMHADGLDGVVFHPRFYPGKPAYLGDDYMRVVSRVILHARERGMAVWLYDENGWPSGIADGELLRRYPEDAASMLALYEGDAPDAWHRFEHGGRSWHLRRVETDAIDYLSTDACRHFLALVHDRYRDGLEPAAWEHVEAIFTDEPEFGLGLAIDAVPPHGAVMWSEGLAEQYAKQVGHDVREDLPAVFFPSEDGSHEAVRIRFWEFMTDRLIDGFFAPYQAWCRREGKLFTGHLKGDEHPLFQVMMNGSCHRVFQHFDMPGIDPLERFPSCDFYARQVTSVARQFGNGRAMAEVMGGGGWGSRPEDFERFLLWLADHGVTDHVIHINQYRLISHAIRDWPPSNPGGLSWREAYPEILRRVQAKVDAGAAIDADTLVVAPYRGIMAGYEPWSLPPSNIHNCAIYPDTAAGRLNDALLELLPRLPAAHHVVDERSFDENGRLDAGRIRIGNHGYRALVLAEGCRLGEAGVRLVQAWKDAGGKVVEPDALPRIEAAPHAQGPATAGMPIQWESVRACENTLLLEPEAGSDGRWSCAFEVETAGGDGGRLDFADAVCEVRVDGNALEAEDAEEGCTAVLPALAAGRHRVEFELCEPDDGPLFVWLTGPFRVLSRSEWTATDDGMLQTDGPWVVAQAGAPAQPGSERVAAGWPFSRGPFVVEGAFETEDTLPVGSRLALPDTVGDAARIELDGRDLGWVWGPDWAVPLPVALAPGPHRLVLHLVPSTFNRYGPHHHLEGDRHVVSCDQFTGRKNFADRPEAPEYTHDRTWRFRPVQAPGRVNLVRAS